MSEPNWGEGFIKACFGESTRATTAPTEDQIMRAARVLCERENKQLGSAADDWDGHSEDFIGDARAMLEAAFEVSPSPSTGGEQILRDEIARLEHEIVVAKRGNTMLLDQMDRMVAQAEKVAGGEPATDSAVTGDAAEMICRLKEYTKHVHNPAGATGRLLIDAAWMVEHLAKELKREAAREPAPVARELDVEAERLNDQLDALEDLRKAVKDEVSDEWLLAFVQQYPFAPRAARATAESAPASAAPREQWISVEDRLPAEYESVLAYGAKRLEWAVMRYSAKEGWEVDDCSEFHNAYPPKFWRALPAAPSNSPVGAKEQDK